MRFIEVWLFLPLEINFDAENCNKMILNEKKCPKFTVKNAHQRTLFEN